MRSRVSRYNDSLRSGHVTGTLDLYLVMSCRNVLHQKFSVIIGKDPTWLLRPIEQPNRSASDRFIERSHDLSTHILYLEGLGGHASRCVHLDCKKQAAKS